MGRTPHHPGKPKGLFGRGFAVRGENVALPSGEKLMPSGAENLLFQK